MTQHKNLFNRYVQTLQNLSSALNEAGFPDSGKQAIDIATQLESYRVESCKYKPKPQPKT